MNGLKHAARRFIRRPALSVVIAVLLALGIGTTTAVFSLYHQVLVAPLPVASPDRLVNLGAPGPKAGSTSCSSAGDCQEVFSYPMFRDFEADQTVFSSIGAHRDFNASLGEDGGAVAGTGIMVSGGYFQTLGLTAAVGRLLGPEDEPAIGESAVVVLSYGYWQSRFGSDPAILGRSLTVNGQSLTVVGVAPEGFRGTTIGLTPEVFVPITLRWLMEPWRARDEDNRRAYWVYLFARLAPGISIEQASAGLNTLYAGILDEIEVPLNSSMTPELLEQFRSKRVTLEPGATGQSQLPDVATDPLSILLGATALVLLIVCIDIANLLLARGVSQAGEMAIRVTIGATPWRLAGQLLVDVCVPAIVGGIASLPVASMTLRFIVSYLPQPMASGLVVELSSTAMLFAGAASLATVALFAVAPAMQAARADPGTTIKGQAAQALGGHGIVRTRNALATAQIALSTVLLALAGLFAQSLKNIADVELGMDVESVVAFTVSPQQIGRAPESTISAFDRIEEDLSALPGVAAVGASRIALLTGRQWGSRPVIEGLETGPDFDNRVLTNAVNAGFFDALSVPVLLGRGLDASDTLGAPYVAVVNESFARKFGLADSVLGTRFGVGSWQSVEIVGVVPDTKYAGVTDEIPPQLFVPYEQMDNLDGLTYYVRGFDAEALMAAIPRIVADIDAELPVTNMRTLETQALDDVFFQRLVMTLAASLAGLATLLAAIGLYGVLAYNVAQRTRELGLRLALGAKSTTLRRMVLGQVGRMLVLGGTLGLVLAVMLGRAAEAMLFGLTGSDPIVLTAALAVVSVVVLMAGFWPARRASNVSPMEALRYE